MDFAHCVAVKWMLVVKGKSPLINMPARKNIKVTDELQVRLPWGQFFKKQLLLRMTKSIMQSSIISHTGVSTVEWKLTGRSDSSTAKGMTCGKTKAKALCKNVLAPYSVLIHSDYITLNNLHFSVATGASNKGTTKSFPIVLRYLHFEEGVQHALLDF